MSFYSAPPLPNNGKQLPPPPYAPTGQAAANISPEQQLTWEWFMHSDRNRTGRLDAVQLQSV